MVVGVAVAVFEEFDTIHNAPSSFQEACNQCVTYSGTDPTTINNNNNNKQCM
jgi:hypothetical protein